MIGKEKQHLTEARSLIYQLESNLMYLIKHCDNKNLYIDWVQRIEEVDKEIENLLIKEE